nr:hypothetical protein [Tanacetum cinerariifolium]
MPPKPDLVFHTAPIAVETDHSAFTVQLSPAKPEEDLYHTNRPSAHITEEWVSDSEDDSETTATQISHMLPKSKPVSVTAVRLICADVPKIMMTRPRHAHSFNTRSNSTIRTHKTCSHSSNTSNSSPKVTAAKAPVVSAAKGKKEKWVWRPKCPILDHDSRTTGEESVIRDPEEESSEKTPTETKSKDKGKGILVEEPKPIKKKQQVKMDEDHELAARLRAEEQR